MVIASIIFAGLSWSVPISKRLYHVITTLIVIFASLSYFAMATGHGVSMYTIDVPAPDHRLTLARLPPH
jgi:bacteriorhodopsin